MSPLVRGAVFAAAAATLALAMRPLAGRHAAVHRASTRLPGPPPAAPAPVRGTPGVANCTLRLFEQVIDHFSFAATPTGAETFTQRVFLYDDVWRKDETGVVFFYSGNESPVELYIQHTGLMWEHAAEFGARLVFAEHRYYGQSQPFGGASSSFYEYMTSTQAAADHAIVAATLAAEAAAAGVPAQPIITFGGSYGGMLSAWLRFKYPATFAGAIAASAPVAFFIGQVPAYDPESYWRVVTADATAAHGAAPACAANVRAAFAAIYAAGATAAGRDNLTKTFDLCSPLLSPADVDDMAVTLHLNAWDTIAMGNFPYESNYLTGGGPLLPAWPVRAACEALADPALGRAADPWPLLAAFNAAGAVFNNATQNLACYAWDTDYWLDGDWDYQWCTENIPEESYFTTDGVHDMFQPRAFNASFVTQHCFDKWGVRPRYSWMTESYGNVWDWARAGASNIVFSNGNYDPWSSAGVNASLSPSLPAVLIDTGAHHLDLFFSNPADPPSVIAARDVELGYIKAWVKEFSSKRSAEL